MGTKIVPLLKGTCYQPCSKKRLETVPQMAPKQCPFSKKGAVSDLCAPVRGSLKQGSSPILHQGAGSKGAGTRIFCCTTTIFFMRSKGGPEFFLRLCRKFPFPAQFSAIFPLHLSVSNHLSLYSILCKLIGTFLFMWRHEGMVVFSTEGRGGRIFFLFCPRRGPVFFNHGQEGDQKKLVIACHKYTTPLLIKMIPHLLYDDADSLLGSLIIFNRVENGLGMA